MNPSSMPIHSKPQRPFRPAKADGTTRTMIAATIDAELVVELIAFRHPVKTARRAPL